MWRGWSRPSEAFTRSRTSGGTSGFSANWDIGSPGASARIVKRTALMTRRVGIEMRSRRRMYLPTAAHPHLVTRESALLAPFPNVPEVAVPRVRLDPLEVLRLARGRLRACDERDDHDVRHEEVVHLDRQFGALRRVHGAGQLLEERVVGRAVVALVVAATPLLRLGWDLVADPVGEVDLVVGLARVVREHLDVREELRRSVRVRDIGGEEHAGVDRLQLDLHAELLPVGLDDGLGRLADGVDGRLVDDLHLHATLGPDAVGTLHPAGVVEELVRRGEVELADIHVRGVLRGHRGNTFDDVAGRPTGEARVDGVGDLLAVGRHRERLADVQGAEGLVLRVRIAAGPACGAGV